MTPRKMVLTLFYYLQLKSSILLENRNLLKLTEEMKFKPGTLRITTLGQSSPLHQKAEYIHTPFHCLE